MFTGIITDMGEVVALDKNRGDVRYTIKTSFDMNTIDMGASICHSGCCLTVVEKGADWFCVDVSLESLDKTTLGSWDVGTKINLERSLKMGDELGGHIVSGHVDGVAEILSIKPEGDSHRLKIRIPEGFEGFIAQKGSVALDGISLTVNEVEGNIFGINIIPHTWDVTTLGQKQVGDYLNFEIDPLARYVARMIEVKG
ncbi:MAG: riboflavin synthase [Micavibrio sp.]|nr:riboflavin synthase [Micavibrio sp.]